ncbi:glycosyltransferase family 39 protein [Actinomadura barringtoniae]|uniref:Glycosyltransferase family 39 protein n=1 Tax=Actinomadura barringtoniae TaxID=1427535 RepID=A0A939PC88_9ACTN|nr:phospholipid carrier-dependent glycosyltransferase [Actinomadura barringtoniae]MBO2449537.1 glycosyltransferase family 39 protein [Actinomadura barringtoniae]
MSRRGWLLVLVVLALLTEMAAAMVVTAVQQTPTIDEPVYVASGVVYVREHSLRYNPEHPPLGKLLIGAGAAAGGARLDPGFSGTQEAAGRHLLYEQGLDADQILLAARLPVIVLTLLFGLVVFAFARDLVGPLGGVVALALYAFSPDLIAHGALATLDVPAAGFVLTALWLAWRAREKPLPYIPLAGLALGAALATKMSTLAAIPVLMGLAALSAVHAAPARALASAHAPAPAPKAKRLLWGAAAAVGVAVIAVAVVWVSYLAVDPRLRWSTPDGTPAVSGLRALMVDLMPFPQPYRDGMRVQFGLENEVWGGFLFGHYYHGSLWYYLPAAILVKSPLGMLALWTAGIVTMLAVPRLRPAAPYVLLPAAALAIAATYGSRDFGTRYVIFLPMLLGVAAGAVVLVRRQAWRVAAAAALGLVVVSSLRTFPYYLPYSNEAFGGPSKTYLRLHDANVDWGQDLGRLADRLRDRYPDQPVWLVYKGSGVPSYYGIRASDPRGRSPDQVHGLLVVSDTSIDKADPPLRALLAGSRRIDEVGHSITIYRR